MRSGIFRMVCGALLCVLPLVCLAADEKDLRQLPEGQGKATTQRLCGKCHGAQIVLGKPHSEDGWGAIVADMVQRGAEGTDDELYEVVQYLTKNIKAAPPLAKVNVNKADAKALESALEISSKVAAAIIETREKSEFRSLDDLKKVPGLDAAKIDAKKGIVVF